jgi:PAS domain S-box-containing protein
MTRTRGDDATLRRRIAELEQENEQLRASYQQAQEALWLRTRAMESATNGISIADATQHDNPLIYVNPAFEYLTGYAPDEVLGRNCRFLQGEETDPNATAEIRAALAEGRDCKVTILNYRKDGTPFWNEFRISPIRDEQGTITHFVGIQDDVTARVQAEQALQESEQRMSGIIASAMDAIITIDSDQRIILFNQAAEHIFGYPADAAIGQHLNQLLPPAVREKHPDYVQEFGSTGVANRAMASQRMVSGRREDGEEFPVEVSISQVYVGGHKLYTAIVRDITQRVRDEEERNRLQEQIIQMQHALVQELSTPLIPISDEIVIMPLVGSVDSLRAQNVMGTLLEGVEKNRSRLVILDITGVPVVDTQVANTLIRSAQAVRLLGARVILTGIGPDIAQTLVSLGVDLGGIITHNTLQSGIAYAMNQRNRRRR